MIDPWLRNDVESAKKVFGPGWVSPEYNGFLTGTSSSLQFVTSKKQEKFAYLGAKIQADFPLSYENLAPYVTQVVVRSAHLGHPKLIVIRCGQVEMY